MSRNRMRWSDHSNRSMTSSASTSSTRFSWNRWYCHDVRARSAVSASSTAGKTQSRVEFLDQRSQTDGLFVDAVVRRRLEVG